MRVTTFAESTISTSYTYRPDSILAVAFADNVRYIWPLFGVGTVALIVIYVFDVYHFLIWPRTVVFARLITAPASSFNTKYVENVEPWSIVILALATMVASYFFRIFIYSKSASIKSY